MTGAERQPERAENSALQGYLGFVERQEALTKADEAALAQRVRDGDREAVDKLVNANLRFVIRFVRRFRNRGLDDLDLIAEGTVGLIMAVRRGGWQGERRLIAVAAWWILDAVHNAISAQTKPGTVLLLSGSPQGW